MKHTQQPYANCEPVPKAHAGPINAAQFDATGGYVLTGGADKTLRLWNAGDRRLVKSFLGHGWEILDVDIAKDSSMFASCGGDKSVFVWDVPSATLLRKMAGHTQRVNTVAFNDTATVLASGSYDATVRLWDLKSNNRAPIQVLGEAKDSVTTVSICEHWILTGSVDGRVRTYDLRFGTTTVDTIAAPVTCARFSGDQQCTLVGSLDGHLRLIDATTGELLNDYTGHVATQYRMACTLDHRDALVLSGSEDGAARVWDLVDAFEVQQLAGHRGPVLSVTAHPSRLAAVTGGADGVLQWWWAEDE
ncbi:hypothetical protein H9P43_009644 [Blastocladiella emersonii ATCC 22665]|nr:hypothetical protein H9P43_009644 [Blastocladiella emersonii ATCC 22665]